MFLYFCISETYDLKQLLKVLILNLYIFLKYSENNVSLKELLSANRTIKKTNKQSWKLVFT